MGNCFRSKINVKLYEPDERLKPDLNYNYACDLLRIGKVAEAKHVLKYNWETFSHRKSYEKMNSFN